MTEKTDIPVYEIDPKKKYILSISGVYPVERIEKIKDSLKSWIADKDQPFFIVNGDLVKLVKVEDTDESL